MSDTDPILPSTGFLRIRRVMFFVPLSRTHIWRSIKKGTFPKAIKLDDGITAWAAEDIRAWIEKKKQDAEQKPQSP